MNCGLKTKEFINKIDDMDRIDRAFQYKAEKEHKEKMYFEAENKGYLTNNRDRLDKIEDYSTLIGKKIVIGEEEIAVKSVDFLDKNKILINNTHPVDIQTNLSTKDQKRVYLGSSKEVEKRNLVKIETVTGPLLAQIDGLVAKAKQLDKDSNKKFDEEYFDSIFELYKDMLRRSNEEVEVTVDFLQDLEQKPSLGKANIKTGHVELVNGNKVHNSMTDILAQELQHILIDGVIKINPNLNGDISKLRMALAKKVDWKVFLPEGSNTQEEIDFAKKRYDYIFYNDNVEASSSEALAGITTNEALMKEVGEINTLESYTIMPRMEGVIQKDKKGNIIYKNGEVVKKPNALSTLWNVIADTINKFYQTMKFGDRGVEGLGQSLLIKAFELGYKDDEERKVNTYKKVINLISRSNEKIANFTKATEKHQKSFRENLEAESKNKIEKALDSLWEIRGLSEARDFMLQNAIFSSMTKKLNNPDIARFYQMFRHTKAFVENAIYPLKQSTLDVIMEKYHLKEMDSSKRKAIKRVLLDTDAKVLGPIKNILKLLKDPEKLQEAITTLENKYDQEILDEMKDTANLLVNGVSENRNVYTNAAQISFRYLGTVAKDTVKDVDKLITLYALEKSSDVNKKLTIEALEDQIIGKDGKLVHKFDDSGDFILDLLQAEEERLVEKTGDRQKMLVSKGQVKEEFAGNKIMYYVDEKEARSLGKRFKILGENKELSKVMGETIYSVVGDSLDAGYTEGMMSKIQLKTEGESLRKMLIDTDKHTEEEVAKIIENIAKDNSMVDSEFGTLVPERSDLGTIYDYKIRVSHEVKNLYLEVDDDIAITTANTVANLTHKQEALIHNIRGVNLLNDMYARNKDNKAYKFIEISEHSDDKFKHHWEEIPFYLRGYIKKNFDGKLMVEQSLLVDFFGYKDVSITNAMWIRNSKNRQYVANKIEGTLKEFTKVWRKSVVAKTLDTVFTNNSSNMVVVMQHTDFNNPQKYFKEFIKMWQLMNEYNKMKKEVEVHKIEQSAGNTKYDNKIKELEHDMANNPVHLIMEDGQYSVILEDTNSDWSTDTNLFSKKMDEVFKKLDDKKAGVGEGLKTIIDTLYIRKDSPLHDSVMKATLYSDAIARSMVLNHLLSEKKMKQKDALNYVDKLFVNYSYLDWRWIKYLNDILILSFTKYMFRIIPALVSQFKIKGASMLLTELVQKAANTDIETPVDVILNPFNSLLNRTGGILEPTNALGMVITPAWGK